MMRFHFRNFFSGPEKKNRLEWPKNIGINRQLGCFALIKGENMGA
jgi:hypothetical protein